MKDLQKLTAAILLAWTASPAWSQSQSITLSGAITDPSGSVVQRVKVQLVNNDTGEEWSTLSTAGGNFTIPLVKPGGYSLTAEAPGFKLYRRTGIVLETGVPSSADIRLEVGVVTESVTVHGSVPLLQTATSGVGLVVDNRTIANMPLAERRAAQLARLAGFTVHAPGIIPPSGPSFSVAGGITNPIVAVDGGTVNHNTLGANLLHFDPPVESMQEFNFSLGNYSASLGRTGGGAIQITTRSGTNQLHGSLYENFRHDKLDARTFFASERPIRRDNLFGASLGGPIRRNKAFFFFNYEGARKNTPMTRILGVPDPDQVRGDFSKFPATAIRDPQAAGRPPFAGNVIPSSRLDPVGAKLASFYPAPNVPGRAPGDRNFGRNQAQLQDSDNYVARIDYNLSDHDRIYGRFLAMTFRMRGLPIFPTPGMGPAENLNDTGRYNPSATWLRTLTPAVVNEIRFTYHQSYTDSRPGGTGLGLAGQIGLKGVNPAFAPVVNLVGLQALGTGGAFTDDSYTNQLIDTVTHIRGKHGLKFGYEWRSGAVVTYNAPMAGGAFMFNPMATNSSLASLLLGWTTQGQRNEGQPYRYPSLTMAAFAEDDWKVTPRLALNLGLRWDWDQPRWEERNRQSSFDPLAINPVSGTPGVVTFSGRNGAGKFAHNNDWNNFGPRAGFAWRVADRWVIRGGSAIMFVGAYFAGYGGPNPGFNLSGSFTSPDMGLTPPFLLLNGIPPISFPTEADLTPGFGAVRVGQPVTTAVQFFEPARRTGYQETFNFNIQRALQSNLLVEAGYLATLGHKIAASSLLSINQVRPELLGPGNAQIRRPFPQFDTVGIFNSDSTHSNYHALNLKVEKRYSRGLQFLANYTWARSIDDADGAIGELGGGGNTFTNVYNRRADRGLSGNHISHRIVWSSVYELPFGRARHPLSRQVLGGWSTGLIAEMRSGSPYGVGEITNGTGTGAFSGQRPNVVGDPELPGNRTRGEQVERWFNTAAFASPAQFSFGNAGATAGYGPGAVIMDVSILKDFRMAERHRLQFRTEMLNFINHANFTVPNAQRGSPAFGRLSGLLFGNQARIVQFGLHYKF